VRPSPSRVVVVQWLVIAAAVRRGGRDGPGAGSVAVGAVGLGAGRGVPALGGRLRVGDSPVAVVAGVGRRPVLRGIRIVQRPGRGPPLTPASGGSCTGPGFAAWPFRWGSACQLLSIYAVQADRIAHAVNRCDYLL